MASATPTRPYPIARPLSGAGSSRGRDRVAYGLSFALFVLLMVTNIAIPKGGIAVGSAPLTFGYAFFAAITPLALIALLQKPEVSVTALFHFLVLYLPLALITLYKVSADNGSVIALLIYAVTFVLLPFAMLVVYSSYLEGFTEDQIGTVFRWCMAFVIVFGIVNFLSYALIKKTIEIPYITVNAADVGEIFSKNNRRGGLMKLVSTYNNGNVCGACMVMLLPLYVYFSKSRLWIGALCLAIILTLSRTAWFGLICAFMVMVMLGQIKISNVRVWIAGGVIVAAALLVMPMIGWTPDKLVDSDLGGRMYQWTDLELSMFGTPRIAIHEILYAGLLNSYGVIGFLLAMAAFTYPVFYGVLALQRLSELRKAALAGIISYLLVAALDAAFIFPPVFLQFLFLAAMLYRRGYRGTRDAAPRSMPAPLGLRRAA